MDATLNATTTLSPNFRFEQTWFFPQKKQIITLFTRVIGTQIIPLLFKQDLNTLEYTQLFPLYEEDYNYITDSLQSIRFSKLNKATITYNSLLKKYLITYSGLDRNIISPQPFVVNFKLTNWDLPRLDSVEIYKDLMSFKTIQTPPLILDVNTNLVFKDARPNVEFKAQLPILNNPTSCKIVSNPTGGQISITNDGYLTANVPNVGTYQVNFSTSNDIGTTYYSITIIVEDFIDE